MGSDNKIKRENLSEEELAAFFSTLAQAVESGKASEEIPDLSRFTKLKISVKKGLEGYAVKMKVKEKHVPKSDSVFLEENSEDIQRPKYKRLKKRMKKSFEEIYDCLVSDELPGEPVVAAFLQDSRLMVSFQEYGADFFPDYDHACVDFKEACEAENLERCKQTFKEIDRLQKACHERCK